VPKSGSAGETSQAISVKNAAAPARDVIEIISPPPGPNRNQCVAAIVEAAVALLREGGPPTVAEAAERALVSRATAYRYFRTQESLLLDNANVETLVKPVEELVASFPADDPAQRLNALVDTFIQAMLSDEALIRTGVRVYMDRWLANQRDGSDILVRAGRPMRYIDEVLRPLGERLGKPGASGFDVLSRSSSVPKPSSP
jgi:AcrR family transcriptional regulator